MSRCDCPACAPVQKRAPLRLVDAPLSPSPNALREEVARLVELLHEHVDLAIETGTEPARIQSLLRNVRTAVLTTKQEV